MLEPTLLLFLHHGEAHGYTLRERLGEYGLEQLNPSVVYRALRDMEEEGWVTSDWDPRETQGPPRRVYQITKLGHDVLGWWTKDLNETRNIIDRLLSVYQRHMEEGEGEYH
jgi:DNA-binding PadR family transcriptional regulator